MTTLNTVDPKVSGNYCFNKGALVTAPYLLLAIICLLILFVPALNSGEIISQLMFKGLALLMLIYLTWVYYNTVREIRIDPHGLHISRFRSFITIPWNNIKGSECTNLPTTGFNLIRLKTNDSATGASLKRFFVWTTPGGKVETEKLEQVMFEIERSSKNHIQD